MPSWWPNDLNSLLLLLLTSIFIKPCFYLLSYSISVILYSGFKSSFMYCFFSVIFGKVSFGVITAPAVQTLDSALHRAIQWIASLCSRLVDSATGFLILIRWIVIYPVDNRIQRFNNRGICLVNNISSIRC